MNPAGMTLEVLCDEFWVPGSTSCYETAKYHGQAMFQEILTTTTATAELRALRATED